MAKTDNKAADNKPAHSNPANETADKDKSKTDEKVLGQCTLTKAPVIKGFALGQTVDEIDSRIPGFKYAYEKEKKDEVKNEKKDSNFTRVSSLTSFPDNSAFDSEEFKDFRFDWHFMSEKLTALFVIYQNEEFDNRKAFIARIIKELDLPKDIWVKESDSEEGTSQRLNCQGFLVDISVNPQLGSQVIISETKSDKK